MLNGPGFAEFDKQYPRFFGINLEPAGHQVVVIDDRMALRAGIDWVRNLSGIRLYIAREPMLFVAQQRFLDEGGLQRGIPAGKIPVLSLGVDKSYSRGVIRIYDRTRGNEESVLFYEGGAKFRLYSDHDCIKLENAPCRLDLEEILARVRGGL